MIRHDLHGLTESQGRRGSGSPQLTGRRHWNKNKEELIVGKIELGKGIKATDEM